MRKTVRVSDLAVGDWVKVDIHPTPRRIASVNIEWSDDGGYVILQGVVRKFKISVIEPIPITPEILKNNGFRCIAVGDNGPSTPRQNYMRYEKWRVETTWGYRDLFFDRMTKRYRFGGMNEYAFTEVHKLQHALRFSNFEKEIVL